MTAFPSNPSDGQIFDDPATGRRFRFDAALPGWRVIAGGGAGVLTPDGDQSISGTNTFDPHRLWTGTRWENNNPASGQPRDFYDVGESIRWLAAAAPTWIDIPAGSSFDVRSYEVRAYCEINGPHTVECWDENLTQQYAAPNLTWLLSRWYNDDMGNVYGTYAARNTLRLQCAFHRNGSVYQAGPEYQDAFAHPTTTLRIYAQSDWRPILVSCFGRGAGPYASRPEFPSDH